MNPYFQTNATGVCLTPWARWLITWHSIGIAYARSLGLRVTVLHDEIIVEYPHWNVREPNMLPRRKP